MNWAFGFLFKRINQRIFFRKNMKIRLYLVLFSLLELAIGGWERPLEAKVYIDIDSPGFRPLPLAVFVVDPPEGSLPLPDPELTQNLVRVVTQDLEVSGFFKILAPDLYLVGSKDLDLHPARIDFHAWALIGAEGLILLQAYGTEKAGEFRCRAQLLDVLTGKLLFHKKYKSHVRSFRKVAHRFSNEVERALTGVEGSFDTRIAYISNATGSKELWTMDYDGHKPKQLTRMHSICLSPAWSPDGNTIAFTSYWKRFPSLYLLDPRKRGKLKSLLKDFSPLCSGAAWSRDGKRIAFTAARDGKTDIFSLPLKGGKKPERLTKSWSIDVSPFWSPEGDRIVFVSGRAGQPDLYTLERKSKRVQRLTFEGTYNADPEWSPKGDWIVFVSRVDGNFHLFRIRPDGTQRTQLTQGHGDHLNPSWSPNGRLITFSSSREGSHDIYLIRMDGTGLKRLTWSPRDETEPAWSPAQAP